MLSRSTCSPTGSEGLGTMGKAARKQRRQIPIPQPAAPGRGVPPASAGGPRRAVLIVEPGYPDEWRIRLHNETVRMKRASVQQRELVAQALAAGATWTEIAKVLQVSRQSAHRRFRMLSVQVAEGVHPPPGPVVAAKEPSETSAER